MTQKRKSLDILKGIAIIMILITHNRHFIMKDMSGMRQLINYCQMGCQIFFVVSGMALCGSWFKQAEKNDCKGFGTHCLRFMQRRYLRIAPGFLIMLALNYFLNFITIDVFEHYSGFVMNREPSSVLTNSLLLHGLSPKCINNVFPGGWYIGTSILLYWLFPLLVSLFALLYNRFKPGIYFLPLIFLLINCLLQNQICIRSAQALYPSNNSFLYFFFTNQLPCFSLGILLYFQEKEGFSKKCPAIFSAVCFMITFIISYKLYITPQESFYFTIIPTIAGLSFYWLTVLFIHLEDTVYLPWLFRPIASFLASCGRHSYGMYLTHALVSWYGIRELRYILDEKAPEYNDLSLFLLLLPITIAIVYLMGCLFESRKRKDMRC